MNRNLFYTCVCVFFMLLMLIAFFLPILVFKDQNYTKTYFIWGMSMDHLPRFLLFNGGITVSFFVYQLTGQEEKGKKPNWPLLGFAGIMAMIALAFLFGTFSRVGDYGNYTYSLSYSPFYALFIALLAGVFYWQRDAAYHLANKTYLKLKERKSKNN